MPAHVDQLKSEIYDLTLDMQFKKSETMGEVLALALDFVKRNYQDVSMKQIIERKIEI